MNFFGIIFVGLAAIVGVTIAMSDEEMADMITAMSDECKKSEGATEDDVKKMVR